MEYDGPPSGDTTALCDMYMYEPIPSLLTVQTLRRPNVCVCVMGLRQDACLAKQSMDNMSVLAIAFKAAWAEGEGGPPHGVTACQASPPANDGERRLRYVNSPRAPTVK